MDSIIIILAKLGSGGRKAIKSEHSGGHRSCQFGGTAPGAPSTSTISIPTLCTGMPRGMGAQGRGVQPLPAPPQDLPAVAVLSCLTLPFPGHRQEQCCTPGPCTPRGLAGIFPGRNALPPLLGFMISYMTFGGLRFEGVIDHYIVLPADIPHSFGKWMLQEYFLLQTLEPKSSLLQLLCKLSNHSAGF